MVDDFYPYPWEPDNYNSLPVAEKIKWEKKRRAWTIEMVPDRPKKVIDKLTKVMRKILTAETQAFANDETRFDASLCYLMDKLDELLGDVWLADEEDMDGKA